jgi:hypothetical protein
LRELFAPLIAESSRVEIVRVQHIRSLWLRIAETSSYLQPSSDFNVFRAEYTYVNIIQVCTYWCVGNFELRAPLQDPRKVLIDNPIEQQITLGLGTLFVAVIRL